jgi:hypothetical protein
MWQPIETAPKDGTGVLMVDMKVSKPEPSCAYFYADRWWVLPLQERFDIGNDDCPWWTSPTHWMPLPTLPSPAE